MLLPYLNKDLIEAGCDEAGRGCLAGAVYAAAVILPTDFKNELLNDSKQLTEKQRYALREVIEKEALAWAVGVVSPEEIDKINILNASFLAMHRARYPSKKLQAAPRAIRRKRLHSLIFFSTQKPPRLPASETGAVHLRYGFLFALFKRSHGHLRGFLIAA